jgi:putative ABC transport system permease protein
MGSLRSAAERIYRRLLGLYPEEFRVEFGEEMAHLFRDRSRDERLSRLSFEVLVDTLKTAPKEQLAMWSQDVRYALRLMWRNPAFTAVAAGSLAIGIGANAAIFSLADAMLLRPLPVARPSQIVCVRSQVPNNPFGASYASVSYADYLDFRDKSRSFEGLVAHDVISAALAPRAGELPRLTLGMLVSGDFFRVLGVEPRLGRGFRPEENEAPGRNPVAVLGHGTWQTAFGGDPDVVGRTIRLNGVTLTVVGVAPASFTGTDQYVRPAVYVPLMMAPALLGPEGERMLEKRDRRGLNVKGRLRPGVSVTQAEAELATIAGQLEKTYPETNKKQSVAVRTPLRARIESSPIDAALVGMLMALVALVLLIACANVANLLLSRSGARAREIAVRLAIGAGGARIVRQLVTEGVLVALLGGTLGLSLAYAGVRFFSLIPMPTDMPVTLTIELDRRVLGFSLLASLLSVLAFGLAPALRATRTDLVSALKEGDAGRVARGRIRGRQALVVAQVALSLVLLSAAASVMRGFEKTAVGDPGFRTRGIFMAAFDPTVLRYTPERSREFYRELVRKARALPGVKSAALTTGIPWGDQDVVNFVPEGRQLPEGRTSLSSFGAVVDEHYFETFGVAIVKGRGFAETDRESSPRVVVVNEEVARKYWPAEDAIGKRVRLDGAEGAERGWAEVVGVAKTHKYLWSGEAPTEYFYLAAAQTPRHQMTILLDAGGDAALLAAPLRDLVRSLDPNMPIHDVRTMEDFFQKRAVNLPRMIVGTVGSMGLLGLLLALVGLYGLMTYSVSRRTREIGIRMAIGADARAVLRMVLRQGLLLSLAGIAVGLAASTALSHGLAALIEGVAPVDPVALAAVPAALLSVTLVAALLPARRAARVDPIRALRWE